MESRGTQREEPWLGVAGVQKRTNYHHEIKEQAKPGPVLGPYIHGPHSTSSGYELYHFYS